ncbi:hypothetical protein KIN20_015641 [Parelaphostrongylus tenuis]|uniref:2-(3-amino-3-carboxypropyl)histidine synthase n=1 Tax=Parelaphostrongylus tenuis TaxID=148309 RepID=A0AAD5MF93_PARTN|nr:hypothetical protein KIN20_015641 [Parelaphostrongylus tenuis]
MVHEATDPIPSTSQFFSGHTPSDQPVDETSSPISSGISEFVKSLDGGQLEEFFHIDKTVEWIRDNNYKRVALQLPDHFLARARRIAELIESKTDAKLFVLADTSYRR